MAESDSAPTKDVPVAPGGIKARKKKTLREVLQIGDKLGDFGNSGENEDKVSKQEKALSRKEESDDNHSYDQHIDSSTYEKGKKATPLIHEEDKNVDALKNEKGPSKEDELDNNQNGCEKSGVELCRASGVPSSDSVSKFILDIRFKSDLYQNENGNYEWQWRNENGWNEEKKHESSNLNAIFESWKKEKGFIIKTKHGYEWHTMEKECINAGMTESLENKGKIESLMGRRPRIVFIGPIGSGKSATINTLLREDKAPSANNLESQSLTKTIKEYETEHYILVDTPGLTEDQLPGLMSYMEHKLLIIVVIVIAASRLRSEEKRVISRIETHLRHYLDKAFFIITRGDDISRNEHEFLDEKKHKELYSLYCSVGKRCLIFENSVSLQEKSKYIDEFQGILKDFSAPKERSSIRTLLNELSNFPEFLKKKLFGLNK